MDLRKFGDVSSVVYSHVFLQSVPPCSSDLICFPWAFSVFQERGLELLWIEDQPHAGGVDH